MGIQSSTVKIGGTVSTTSGTDTNMLTKGGTLNELVTVLDDSSEFIDQIRFRFNVVDPKVSASAPNGYTQQRSIVKVVFPLGLDNGKRTTNTLEIKLSCDPETQASEKDSYMVLGAQLLSLPDFQAFFQEQSLV